MMVLFTVDKKRAALESNFLFVPLTIFLLKCFLSLKFKLTDLLKGIAAGRPLGAAANRATP
jgi:hypothetical protein